MSDSGVRADPPGNAIPRAAIDAAQAAVRDAGYGLLQPISVAKAMMLTLAAAAPVIAAQAARDERQAIRDDLDRALAQFQGGGKVGISWVRRFVAARMDAADLLRGAETTGDKR